MTILLNLLFFFTPLIFTSANSELFELPKMYFVYGSTIIIVATHIIAAIQKQVPLFKKTILDIPLFLFLLSQIISTFLSIDIHTSIFGYYSRLNGGLLSTVCYLILYWSLVPHLTNNLKNNLIRISLLSGLFVSIYGIAQHFGIDKNWWIQDVQSRVFSTLGQPNWLAAYLCILLPISFHQFLNSKSKLHSVFYFLLSTVYYLSLLFTKSKSGIVAAIISIGIYFIFSFVKKNISPKFLILNSSFLILLTLLINNPVKDYFFSPKLLPAGRQENLNITPSEDIRKLVWQGSFKLWQQFPLFGTGPETFAYSYYWTRPATHNLTSEWDFLYNKAHNEYLNYLATTGSFGFLTYLMLIITILIVLFPFPYLLAAFVSLLITNTVGFSVVVTSLYFFLLPLLALPNYSSKLKSVTLLPSILVIILALFLSYKNLTYFLADICYASADSADLANQYPTAQKQIQLALSFRPNEPIYLIKAAAITSKMALINKSPDLAKKAATFAQSALNISPFNLNLYKESAQIYYYLSGVDSQYYLQTLDSLTKAGKLAPTDAKTFYTLGEFYNQINETDQAIVNYQKALDLKSNYDYAAFALGKIYFDQKKYPEAKSLFEKVLEIAPTSTDAKNYLAKIATLSATKK